MSGPACADNVQAGKPLNMDPDALAVLDQMRGIMKRFQDAGTDDEAWAVVLEGRALVPAYEAACRTIGIGGY